MCGIAGCLVPPGSPVDRGALERMSVALGHRGPDDQGLRVVGRVGLVHRRLAILDPTPAGHQPMSCPDGRWWLTYNGEIFNHLALRAELSPRTWRGGSDTETLLAALAAWDTAAVARCNGLFAFAAYDRVRGRLLLVRDRFGVKPLYYARHDGAIWFASEMRALLAAGVPRKVRGDVLDQAIRGWSNGPLTPLAAIRRVLPGTLLAVDTADLRTAERRWYHAAGAVEPERIASLRRLPRRRATDAMEAELRASVRRRLLSDVPVGVMCSGGLDSSLIAAFAREQAPAIHAFNASIVDQPAHDEGPVARRVAAALGIELHTAATSAESWRRGFVATVAHNEYPLTHESSVAMAQIAELARARGVKVLLSGEGADELLGGYEHLHAREHRAFAARRRPLALLSERLAPRAAEPSLAPPGVAEYEATVLRAWAEAYRDSPRRRARLERVLGADLDLYLPHLLNRQDKNTMQHSIETRVPFLDPDVVSLALNLPLEQRLEPASKGILREVAARHLPVEVSHRAKIGFGFDVAGYIKPAARPEFLGDGCLREIERIPLGPWGDAVARLHGQSLQLVWSAEVWCRLMVEDQPVEDVEAELWSDVAQRHAPLGVGGAT